MAVFDELLEFVPLFPEEDEAAILERWEDWANEGVDPGDGDEWVDVQEGSQWRVCVTQPAREFARLYDLMGTEVPASGFVGLSWGSYLDDHADVVDIVRLAATPAQGEETFSGPAGTAVAAGSVVGVEPIGPDDEAPEYEVVTGGVIPDDGGGVGESVLAIEALEAGVAGNVAPGAVVVVSTGTLAGVEVVNAAALTGGSEPETDDALRRRVLEAYLGKGAGNVRDYVQRASAWDGVGRVTVIPLWDGPNTVKVIVSDAAGDPLPGAVVDALQADLDPVPAEGAGWAPIGAAVTVATATARPLDVEAEVEHETGFSLDGTAGTIATREDIATALREYIERVDSGGEVVAAQIAGRIVTVDGVHDANLVQLDGVGPPAVNVAIDSDPAEAPQLGTLTLTEAVL